MSAAILDFPSATSLLELEGYTLIAWRRGWEGEILCQGDYLYGLWKPAKGRGWYRTGYRIPARRQWGPCICDNRVSRSVALRHWHSAAKAPHNWQYLCTEAEAFPERRRHLCLPRACGSCMPGLEVSS